MASPLVLRERDWVDLAILTRALPAQPSPGAYTDGAAPIASAEPFLVSLSQEHVTDKLVTTYGGLPVQ